MNFSLSSRPFQYTSEKSGKKLESRKVFAKVETVAGSYDYFGNLVIFKIYELNSVRFAVIYKSGMAIFYHKGNYKLTHARTYLLYDQRSARSLSESQL